jgi:uncharacterized protein YjiS (DUF1127 family)
MKVMSLGTATERGTRLATQRVRRRTLRASLRQGLKRILAVLHQWRRISRDRAELANLDDRMLRDIGVTRVDVWREINKPFWRK